MANTSATLRRGSQARRRQRPTWRKNLRHDWPIHTFMITGLLISSIPILFMLMISMKSQAQYVTKPLQITFPIHWDNYIIAFNVLKRSLLNSAWLAIVNVLSVLTLASISAYVFARFQFPGRNLLFWLILAILFIPGILTFAPRYVLVSQMRMLDTFWVLILPYVAGSTIFEIFVLRSFFAGISGEVIEAAKVDGAGVMTVFWKIVIPMSRPILATLAVVRTMDWWNEWLWPLVTVQQYALRPMALQVFYLANDIGPQIPRQMAGYAIASIPLLILFALFSKQFVEGLTSGAIKW